MYLTHKTYVSGTAAWFMDALDVTNGLLERRSQRYVARTLGVARDTVAKAVASDVPPKYVRPPASSMLDPFREWICAQLTADPSVPPLRLREMASELGYQGGKSIFDEYVREVRPRFEIRRTFQRTIYRPGSFCSSITVSTREHQMRCSYTRRSSGNFDMGTPA